MNGSSNSSGVERSNWRQNARVADVEPIRPTALSVDIDHGPFFGAGQRGKIVKRFNGHLVFCSHGPLSQFPGDAIQMQRVGDRTLGKRQLESANIETHTDWWVVRVQ